MPSSRRIKEVNMWSFVSIMVSDTEKIDQFLRDNYEPFAVSPDTRSERVWLKKEVDETNYESSKPKPRASRRVAPKSKG